MNRYSSVFALYARSAIVKLLLILLLMTAVQAALFALSLDDMLALAHSDPNQGERFEDVLEQSRPGLALLAASVLLTAALCVRGADIGSRESYTLQRLRISEKGVFCMQWLFSSLAWLLLWLWQALVVVAFAAWYGLEVEARFFGPQTLFLATWRSGFFHSLLPMSNLVRWLRNLIVVAALGASCAKFCWSRRRGRRLSVEAVVILAVCAVFSMAEPPGYGYDAFVAVVSGIAGAYAADKALGKEEPNEEA